jgi:hypothetical protein
MLDVYSLEARVAGFLTCRQGKEKGAEGEVTRQKDTG